MIKSSEKFYKKSLTCRFLICIAAIFCISIGVFLIIITKKIDAEFGDIHLDQIIFHIMMPMDVVNPKIIKKLCSLDKLFKLYIFVTGIDIFLLFLLIFKTGYNFIYKTITFLSERIHILLVFFSISIFCIEVILFCAKFHVAQSAISLFQKSKIIDENYVPVSINEFRQCALDGIPLTTQEKPNLILILSESLEGTFSDKSIFHEDLLKELTELKYQGTFTDYLYQANGCHYTIASMYSILYGMPLLFLEIRTGDPVVKNVFHKHCISIFDILSAADYNICHLQGSSLKFAGQGTLFQHISGARCIGSDEISQSEYPDRSRWGLWDYDLFNIAKKEISSLSKKVKPFAFSLQTIDTHAGLSLQPGQEQLYNDSRDIVRLQSKLIRDFVDWVNKQPFGKKTVIVILGDHNRMDTKLGRISLPPPHQRRVFNCILNSQTKGTIAGRTAAEFDFAPTILEALSFRWKSYSLGIGRSLYQKHPTILEKYGLQVWNSESQRHSKLYTRLVTE